MTYGDLLHILEDVILSILICSRKQLIYGIFLQTLLLLMLLIDKNMLYLKFALFVFRKRWVQACYLF